MTLSASDIDTWARVLHDATGQRRDIAGISKSVDISADEAYAIQAAGVGLRVEAGETVVGAKAGLTSRAKQVQMGVEAPIFGVLTDGMTLSADGGVEVAQLIHPRCEPELVFLMGDDVSGAATTAEQVLDATESVHGGIEVIDSRYSQFQFTFADVIADNTSAARYVVGTDGVAPRSVDLRDIECSFRVNGETVSTATGAALLGDPAECVAALVRHLDSTGQGLVAGDWVLAGGLTDAAAIEPGDVVRASYSCFADVEVIAR